MQKYLCLTLVVLTGVLSAWASQPEAPSADGDASLRDSRFIVVSKRDQTLSVYEMRRPVGDTLRFVYGLRSRGLVRLSDTVLVARYPVCLSRDRGQKQRRGDMRTPSSPPGQPFRIVQIQDASTWRHDFGDGRGSILAYGHWFHRLLTPGFSGIGIHGSTGNEDTVPGRASEGCIRLHDRDLEDLHDRFTFVGMEVIIKDEDEGPLSFEEQDAPADVSASAPRGWMWLR